jgi:hypothetical protein
MRENSARSIKLEDYIFKRGAAYQHYQIDIVHPIRLVLHVILLLYVSIST